MVQANRVNPSNRSSSSRSSSGRIARAALLIIVFLGAHSGAIGSERDLSASGSVGTLNGDLTSDDATNVHAFERFGIAAHEMLYRKDFDRLDHLADSLRSSKAKFSGGMWKIHALYAGTSTVQGHATEKDWKELKGKLDDWVTEEPSSVTARVSLARFYLNYAWDARGDGFVDTVTSNGWKLFQSRTAKAREILEGAAALPAKCPEWYLAMQDVALNQGWDKEQAKSLLERATAFEPDYYYYYRSYARFVLPKWNGEPGEAESFAQDSADRAGGQTGDILYFRIASYLMCHCDGEPQLKSMSFSRIRKGFTAAETQYGASLSNMNFMAAMASKMGEASIANALFQQIGDRWIQEVWQNQSTFEYYKDWAANLGPALQSITDRKDAGEANMGTPEGKQYDAEFRKKYGSVIQMCFQSSDPALGRSDVYVKIGNDGTMEDMMAFGKNPAAACLYQLVKKKLSPPSQNPYWVKLTFDPNQLHASN
jgi:Domain of unknown function (DUF4034)